MRIMQKRLYGSSKTALKLGENSKSSLFFNAPPPFYAKNSNSYMIMFLKEIFLKNALRNLIKRNKQ